MVTCRSTLLFRNNAGMSVSNLFTPLYLYGEAVILTSSSTEAVLLSLCRLTRSALQKPLLHICYRNIL